VLKVTAENNIYSIEFGYGNCSLDAYMWRLSLALIVLALLVYPRNARTQQKGGNTNTSVPETNLRLSAQKADVSREQASSAPSIPAITPPIQGIKAYQLRDSFNEIHAGHRHEAIDIMEPAGTPVRAVVDGTIQKLFLSKAGGNTIYEFDQESAYCYYYAHLERYAGGLHEGMKVSRGEVIGYVGSTGDASPAAPHLHFAIYVLGPERRWWKGTAIDPYPILERSLIASRSPSAPVYLILEMLHAAS
jgi:murein DD-endopeptidase MepM/ murein hydrolase activator NlpD